MAIRKVEIERLTVHSSKSFEAVVAALKAAVGQPDMVEFFKETRGGADLLRPRKHGSKRPQSEGADVVYGTRSRRGSA